MPIVLDASALIYATTETAAPARGLLERLERERCHAPHLIDAELGNVLRRKVGREEMAADHAAVVLAHAGNLVDQRYEHGGWLGAFAWTLRNNVTFYDGLYVALAAALDLPLVTVDDRLSGAPDLPCRIEDPVYDRR